MTKNKLLLKLGIKSILAASLMGCGSAAYLLFSPEPEPNIKEKIKTIYSWNFEDKGDRIMKDPRTSTAGSFKEYEEEYIEAKFKLTCNSGTKINKELNGTDCRRRIESGAGSSNHPIHVYLDQNQNQNINKTTYNGWFKYKFIYKEDIEPGRKEYYGLCSPLGLNEGKSSTNPCHDSNFPEGWTKIKLN